MTPAPPKAVIGGMAPFDPSWTFAPRPSSADVCQCSSALLSPLVNCKLTNLETSPGLTSWPSCWSPERGSNHAQAFS